MSSPVSAAATSASPPPATATATATATAPAHAPAAAPRLLSKGWHAPSPRVLLPWLAFLSGALLLLVPTVSVWLSLGLVAGALAVPVIIWVHCVSTFECDFADLGLTSEDVAEGLDW